jgi:hypothetical protein
MSRNFLIFVSGFLTLFGSPTFALFAEDELYVSRPFTEVNSFTPGVEGPAVDREGNFYAVNFGSQHTIGKVSVDGNAELRYAAR